LPFALLPSRFLLVFFDFQDSRQFGGEEILTRQSKSQR